MLNIPGDIQKMIEKYMQMFQSPEKALEFFQEFYKSYVDPNMWQDFVKKYMDMFQGYLNIFSSSDNKKK